MEQKKLSLAYRLLKTLGFNYSEEEYGQIGFAKLFGQLFGNIYHALLLSMMNWWILEPVNPRMLRAFLLRRLGAQVGKGVFIGDHVKFDMNHADMITVEDRVHITGGTRLLCHQRNLADYRSGDDYSKLNYKIAPIHLKKGCAIGMESFIMPGVTVGEGAVVGAGSLVTKDIPDWTIAVGRPAVVVKRIPHPQS